MSDANSLTDIEIRTGRHLTWLGTLLILGVIAISGLMVFAFHSLTRHFAEGDGGVALAWAFSGLSLGIAGVLAGASKMLDKVSSIVEAKKRD
jgi:hypothetical protein